VARGRKPRPIELRDADGNPSRRPLPAPVKTEPLDTAPPPLLGPAGVELWRELTGRLGAVGALDAVDRAGLTALCLQWDRAAEAARVLCEQGHYVKGSMGQLAAHPALAIERSAHLAVMKFCAEYAATPVARARIATAQAQRQQQQEFDAIVDAEPIEIDDPSEIDGDGL
jgi:P27 family predicted phage terminase small subunit